MSHESRQMFLPGEALLACMNYTEGWRKSSHVFLPRGGYKLEGEAQRKSRSAVASDSQQRTGLDEIKRRIGSFD